MYSDFNMNFMKDAKLVKKGRSKNLYYVSNFSSLWNVVYRYYARAFPKTMYFLECHPDYPATTNPSELRDVAEFRIPGFKERFDWCDRHVYDGIKFRGYLGHKGFYFVSKGRDKRKALMPNTALFSKVRKDIRNNLHDPDRPFAIFA